MIKRFKATLTTEIKPGVSSVSWTAPQARDVRAIRPRPRATQSCFSQHQLRHVKPIDSTRHSRCNTDLIFLSEKLWILICFCTNLLWVGEWLPLYWEKQENRGWILELHLFFMNVLIFGHFYFSTLKVIATAKEIVVIIIIVDNVLMPPPRIKQHRHLNCCYSAQD